MIPEEQQGVSGRPAAHRRIGLLGPLLVAAAAVVMMLWTWRAWPDPVIDFGQQLYVSWRLAEGDALYLDVAYHYGPLSPWFNALLFRQFGVGLMTLVAGNMLILAGVILLLYRLLVAIGGRLSATVAGMVFVAAFAFGQLVEYGNYNFVCPYVHGVTHGMLLSLLSIGLLGLYHRRPGPLPVAGIGITIGLLFLTKAELFLAGSLAVAAGLAATLHQQRPPGKQLVRIMLVLIVSALLPPLCALALLAARMPFPTAVAGWAGSWPSILGGEVGRLPMYRWSMGLHDPGHSLKLLLKSIAWYGLLLAPPALLGLALRKAGRHRPALAVATSVVIAAFLVWWPVWWPGTTLLLPPAMAVICVTLAAGLFRRRGFERETSRRILALTLALFALLLLGRILLFARTSHYGFALAMPATLISIVALIDWLPGRIERAGGCGGLLRAATLVVCAAFALGHLVETRHYLALKTDLVASGRDAFRADRRGGHINAMLEYIVRETAPDATLAVLPAGVMLSYLSRRASSTPYIYFMPSDFLIYGEEGMLKRFQTEPPDFVLLAHKDTSEFGARFFGRDYGRPLHSWMLANYEIVRRTGAPPLRDERFGMTLMRRLSLGSQPEKVLDADLGVVPVDAEDVGAAGI